MKRYGGKVFEIEVLEVKPSQDANGISIIETDLSVDFAPPIGYVEPSSYASSHKMSRDASILGTTPTLQEYIVPERESFKAFGGQGSKLKKVSGLTRQLREPSALATAGSGGIPPLDPSAATVLPSSSDENIVPPVLNLPPGRLFFGYPIKLKKKLTDGEEKKGEDLGPGNTLRSSRPKQ